MCMVCLPCVVRAMDSGSDRQWFFLFFPFFFFFFFVFFIDPVQAISLHFLTTALISILHALLGGLRLEKS